MERIRARGCAALTDLYKLLCMDHLIARYSGILSCYTQEGSSSDKKEAEVWLHLGYISKESICADQHWVSRAPEIYSMTQWAKAESCVFVFIEMCLNNTNNSGCCHSTSSANVLPFRGNVPKGEMRSARPWPGPWPYDLSTCLLGICCLHLCSLTTRMWILSELHNAISAQQMDISSLLELSITQTRMCFQTHTNRVVPTQGNNSLNWSTWRKTKNSFRPGCLRKFKKVCTQPYISLLMQKKAQRCPHNTS